ncbi:tetratricopeptide repeat protein [Candidatus Omnitrophota bacterium]
MEDLEFEISFYQRLLKENPDFIDALLALGNAYTKSGRYKDGLAVDQRLTQLKPDEPLVHYNLACSYSLLKESDSALEALKRTLDLGYRDLKFMEQDPDLSFIRQDPRYKELLFKYAKKGVGK